MDNFFRTREELDGFAIGRFIVEVVTALERAGHLSTRSSTAGADLSRERRLATLHFYAYCNGIFGARVLAGQLSTDRMLQEIAGGESIGFRDLLAFRDEASERLALFFTEILLALADCGLDTVLQTPLHSITKHAKRVERTRASADLAITLLNAAKRRDDLETARYGLDTRGDELPPELRSANDRQHRVQAMLRLRSAERAGSQWDEPTQLIELNPSPRDRARKFSHFENVTAATQAVAGKLLPRLRPDDWQAAGVEHKPEDNGKRVSAPWPVASEDAATSDEERRAIQAAEAHASGRFFSPQAHEKAPRSPKAPRPKPTRPIPPQVPGEPKRGPSQPPGLPTQRKPSPPQPRAQLDPPDPADKLGPVSAATPLDAAPPDMQVSAARPHQAAKLDTGNRPTPTQLAVGALILVIVLIFAVLRLL